MPRPDPIELLRNAYNIKLQKKIQIRLKGRDLYFDRDIKLSLDTQTAWQSTQTSKQFNLGSLWLYLQLHFKKIADKTEYFKKISQLSLEPVGVADAPQIVKYFSGQVNQSKCINNQLRSMLTQKSKQRDRPVTGQDIQDKLEKKIKTQTKLDQQTQNLLKYIEYLNTMERPMNSKSRCLKFGQKKFTNILTHIIQNQNVKATKPVQAHNNNLNKGKYRIVQIYQRKRVPIIIVPQKTIPGNVSLGNIQKFLLKGEYDQYGKLSNSEVSKLEIQKHMRGKNIIFQINSRPQLMSENDWQNVVAVFVLGRQNQFDHWPYKNYKKVFQNSLGYLVKFQKSSSGLATQWKCKIKNLDVISRIEDKQVVQTIWQDIQNFIFTRV